FVGQPYLYDVTFFAAFEQAQSTIADEAMKRLTSGCPEKGERRVRAKPAKSGCAACLRGESAAGGASRRNDPARKDAVVELDGRGVVSKPVPHQLLYSSCFRIQVELGLNVAPWLQPGILEKGTHRQQTNFEGQSSEIALPSASAFSVLRPLCSLGQIF